MSIPRSPIEPSGFASWTRRPYIVVVADGRIECSCPDASRRPDAVNSPCKHVKALIATGVINPSVPSAPAIPSIVPSANGKPESLLAYIESQASAYRAMDTPESAFLADQLDRIAQIAVWVKATTPLEYADRLDVMDARRDDDIHQRGYAEGFDAGLQVRSAPPHRLTTAPAGSLDPGRLPFPPIIEGDSPCSDS